MQHVHDLLNIAYFHAGYGRCNKVTDGADNGALGFTGNHCSGRCFPISGISGVRMNDNYNIIHGANSAQSSPKGNRQGYLNFPDIDF